MPTGINTTNQNTFFVDVVSSSSSTNPYVLLPATHVPNPHVEPAEPTPIEWLKDQVAEICELARAA